MLNRPINLSENVPMAPHTNAASTERIGGSELATSYQLSPSSRDPYSTPDFAPTYTPTGSAPSTVMLSRNVLRYAFSCGSPSVSARHESPPCSYLNTLKAPLDADLNSPLWFGISHT